MYRITLDDLRKYLSVSTAIINFQKMMNNGDIEDEADARKLVTRPFHTNCLHYRYIERPFLTEIPDRRRRMCYSSLRQCELLSL